MLTEEQVRCACIKLDRAITEGEGGEFPTDPVSQFTAPEIVRYLLQDERGSRAVDRRGVRELAEC